MKVPVNIKLSPIYILHTMHYKLSPACIRKDAVASQHLYFARTKSFIMGIAPKNNIHPIRISKRYEDQR